VTRLNFYFDGVGIDRKRCGAGRWNEIPTFEMWDTWGVAI
jgi:hypothetical protein